MNEKRTIHYRDKIKKLLLLAQVNSKNLDPKDTETVCGNSAGTWLDIQFLIDNLYSHTEASKEMIKDLRVLNENILNY